MVKIVSPSAAKNGHRLTFLIESKPKEGLSSRKLLLESSGHNVLTSYSGSANKQAKHGHNYLNMPVSPACLHWTF
jgi:hypothetical protein